MALTVRHQTAQEICATVGPTVIRICDGVRTEIEDLERIDRLFDELLETHANVAILLVFTHGTPMPDGAAQRHAKDNLTRLDGRVVHAIVALGLGFWASTMRALISTILRVVQRGGVSIDATVEQAVAHLCMELVGVDGDELLRAYEQLWAELQASQTARSA